VASADSIAAASDGSAADPMSPEVASLPPMPKPTVPTSELPSGDSCAGDMRTPRGDGSARANATGAVMTVSAQAPMLAEQVAVVALDMRAAPDRMPVAKVDVAVTVETPVEVAVATSSAGDVPAAEEAQAVVVAGKTPGDEAAERVTVNCGGDSASCSEPALWGPASGNGASEELCIDERGVPTTAVRSAHGEGRGDMRSREGTCHCSFAHL